MAQPYYLIVAYDGTDYYGWQEQKREQTVAGTLQDRFARAFHQEIKVVGASRTDAGVHALHQVARFHTDIAISPQHIKRVWNASLPKDIHIRELDISPVGFHPQHNIAQKRYYYHIFAQRPLPFLARYGWWSRYSFDAHALERALQTFVGTHDFRSFCSGDYTGMDTTCTITHIGVRWYQRYGVYQVRVHGDRFMQHMVRRMVGAAWDVATQRGTYAALQRALEAKDPQQHFTTAPGCGLVLRDITYKDACEAA